MKQLKKGLCFVVAMVLMFSMLIPSVSEAKKKTPKLNKSTLKITVGKTAKLKVKNTKKKAKWSIKSGKKKIKLKKKKKKSVVVYAKKAGKATVIAKVGKKKLKCKVTVKAKNSTKKNATTIPVKIAKVTIVNPETLQVVLTSAQALSVGNFTVRKKTVGYGRYNKVLSITGVTTTDKKTYTIKLNSENSVVNEGEYLQVTVKGLKVTGTAVAETVYNKADEYSYEEVIAATVGSSFERSLDLYGAGFCELISKTLPAGVTAQLESGKDVGSQSFEIAGKFTGKGIKKGKIIYRDETGMLYTLNLVWVVGTADEIVVYASPSYAISSTGQVKQMMTSVYASGGSGEYEYGADLASEDMEWSGDCLYGRFYGVGAKRTTITVTDINDASIKGTCIWAVSLLQGKKVTLDIKNASGKSFHGLRDEYSASLSATEGNDPYSKNDITAVEGKDGNLYAYLQEGKSYNIYIDVAYKSKILYDVKITNSTNMIHVVVDVPLTTFSLAGKDLTNVKWTDKDDQSWGTGSVFAFSEGNYELYGTLFDGGKKISLKAQFVCAGKDITIVPTIVSESDISEGDLTLANSTGAGYEISAGSDYRFLSFVPEESGTYRFWSENPSADPMAVLMNGIGDELDSNDDVEEGVFDFSIVYQLEAGQTYYIGVKAFNDSGEGEVVPVCVEKQES